MFLGELCSPKQFHKPWTATIQVKYDSTSDSAFTFKLDAWGDITVAGNNNYRGANEKLATSDRKLAGPGSTFLPV